VRPAALKFQTSSGGIIFRRRAGQVEIALIAVKGGSAWCLPKGIVDKGENPEETALREVREETGLTGRILGKIGSISYWYFIKEENAKCKKTVEFYLMEYEKGDTRDHDFEVDEAAWFPIGEAVEKASYKGDREIIRKAEEMIAQYVRKGP
jgi:8-oxo-dGTP pyrophosphatase MutT (NUDIX family)